jgi:hypothetical protein
MFSIRVHPRSSVAHKLLILYLLALAAKAAPVLNSVEFPFSQFPRQLWDRELVWMKNAGIRTIALEVRSPAEEQDLMTILRAVRKLEISAWVRLGPQAAPLSATIEPMLAAHGGPIAYLNSAVPQPVTRISVLSPTALATSRNTLGTIRGTLLWTEVESTLRPEFHRGAISFLGEELPSIGSLRRDALLVGYWQPGLDKLTVAKDVHPSEAKLPLGVSARQLLSPDSSGASVVSIINRSKLPFRGDLRVLYPPAKRSIALLGIEVPAAESLWLPINIPLAKGPFCKNCSALSNEDSIVYSTAELIDAEYENGILAMEFASPVAGEVIVHLSKEPSGPLLAAGKPRTFDWDASAGRARLPVPAGKAPSYRVRIGLALEPPDHSAFFEDAKILIIGQKNILPTTYTSEAIASRSRVRGPADLKFQPIPKGPLQIDYEVAVPPAELHGDHLELALEADGVQLGHARPQLLRPASLRVREAISRHFGSSAELPMSPALVSIDQRAGRDITVTVRNNFPEIKNFVLELSGDGLEFSPPRSEISIAASGERDVSIRVFSSVRSSGLCEAAAKLTGAGNFDLPILFAVIPRGETISYSADGVHILESAKVRAVFADEHEQKWFEFTWKESDRNVLPDTGIDLGPSARKVTLKDEELTIDQESPLPPEKLKAGKRADITLQIQHPTPGKTVYSLSR